MPLPSSGGKRLGLRPLLQTAAGIKGFARQPAGILGSEENCDRRDVCWLSQAAKRRLRNHLLFEIAADDACRDDAFSLYATRRDGVDADVARTELLWQGSG